MRTRFTLDDQIYTLRLTTEHPASSHGVPVLVTQDGEAVDPFSFLAHVVLEASLEELQAAREAGYIV